LRARLDAWLYAGISKRIGRGLGMIRVALLSIFFVGAMTISASAVTCSEGKKYCLNSTGGTEATCEARRQLCMSSGCWRGYKVDRCGYTKK
jgi:hypothetical protein